MTVRIVSTMNDFHALEDVWNHLYQISDDCDVFMTHRWLQLWFEHFGAGCGMFVLVWEENSRVQAIAPFIISNEKKWRMQWQVLRFPLRASVGPLRCNFLLGNRPNEAMDVFVSFLREENKRWDVALLEGLLVNGNSKSLLTQNAARNGLKCSSEGSVGRARYMTLSEPWEGYVRSRSSHLRKHLHQENTRLNKQGKWTFIKIDSRHDIQTGLDAIHHILHKRYRAASTEKLPADDQKTLHFFDELCVRFGQNGQLDMRLLDIEQQPAACLISLVDRGKAYPLLTKYDPAFDAASPGRAIITSLLSDALNCGYREVDFLSDWEYLGRFTDDARDFIRVRLSHRGWRARLYGLLEYGEQIRIQRANRRMLQGQGRTG